MRVLFVASEAFPLVKTGGLADVAGSLPACLQQLGCDLRLLIPGYPAVLEQLEAPRELVRFKLNGQQVRLLEQAQPGGVTTWIADCTAFARRTGHPYNDERGEGRQDNAAAFMRFCRLVSRIGLGTAGLSWQPDIVHANDWHTGPAIALLAQRVSRPRTVFTIHNMNYLGIFDRATFDRLRLPKRFWHHEALEFYGQLCFMKGGLVYADRITTVSPSYAEEICRAPAGMGLEGLLAQRSDRLSGILNGIDTSVWDPATDPHIDTRYTLATLQRKARNTRALRRELGLASDNVPLLGLIGRLVEQKGIQLLLPVLDEVLSLPAQLVVLGTGHPHFEAALQAQARRYAGSMVFIPAYNEPMAHRIEAGADLFLMPSLTEPCGLNQLYSMRYGTPPLVRRTGGLADTVVDAECGEAGSGFVFDQSEPGELLAAIRRAVGLRGNRRRWRALQERGMAQDFSWHRSAAEYLALYRELVLD